jgi:hypothetical protein
MIELVRQYGRYPLELGEYNQDIANGAFREKR